MRVCPREHRARSFSPLLTFLLAFLPGLCSAIDEADRLALLVETLGSVEDSSIQASLLKGMLSGVEGRRNVEPPKAWASLYERLSVSENPSVRERSLALSQIFGDQSAVETALSRLTDSVIDVDRRREALSLLLSQKNQEASNLLKSLIDNPEMTLDAIRGYALVENVEAPSVLLSRFSDFDPHQQRAVIETLASRKVYAHELLKALESGRISKKDIPAQVAHSLSDMLGNRFARTFGEIRPIGEDRTALIEKYKRICNPEAIAAGDALRGRAVFQRTCASCHTLYGQGGNVGPDLTGSNRANLDYILLNSVDPSYDVPDAYRTVTVLTVDGRVVNGVLAEEDSTRIILKTAEQPRVVIAKQDIEERRISQKSLMPDGQLEQMERQEVIDLIKYLRTTEQVEISK